MWTAQGVVCFLYRRFSRLVYILFFRDFSLFPNYYLCLGVHRVFRSATEEGLLMAMILRSYMQLSGARSVCSKVSCKLTEVGGGRLFSRCTPVLTRVVADFSVDMSSQKKICILGSGNWGSAIAKIVGNNVTKFDQFDNEVKMYVYEEMVDGRKLTEIINTTHENVKYLPGKKLPPNVIAVPDVLEAAKDADVLIFVIPHQFIKRVCQPLTGKLKPTTVGLSLIKGFDLKEGGGIMLISHLIREVVNIPVSVLMGANLAGEVADEKFCETTIGCRDVTVGKMYRDLIQTDYFRVVVVDDVEAVEVCGALKNIVATGAGFVDGLGYGDNTKAAVIRLGLMEMIKFCEVFYPGSKLGTFFESCGVADLITTCYGGRNRRVAEAFVKTGKTIEELEKEMLNGQKLQGPYTALEVNHMLREKNMEDRFPLFTAIHQICLKEMQPAGMIDCIRNHPEHMPPNCFKISMASKEPSEYHQG